MLRTSHLPSSCDPFKEKQTETLETCQTNWDENMCIKLWTQWQREDKHLSWLYLKVLAQSKHSKEMAVCRDANTKSRVDF